jgi:hypothetical protein
MTLEIILLVASVLVVVFQLLVSVRLLRFSGYSGRQKTWQFLVIWFIPFFGAWFVNYVISCTLKRVEPADQNFIPNRDGNTLGG